VIIPEKTPDPPLSRPTPLSHLLPSFDDHWSNLDRARCQRTRGDSALPPRWGRSRGTTPGTLICGNIARVDVLRTRLVNIFSRHFWAARHDPFGSYWCASITRYLHSH